MNLSPIARRRINNFKANRRGLLLMWVFFVLFGLSLFAELIANDKPIVLYLNGEWHFPVLELVTEAELGGEMPIEADYADPYVRELIARGGVGPSIPSSPTATTPSISTSKAPRRRSRPPGTGWAPTTAPRTPRPV